VATRPLARVAGLRRILHAAGVHPKGRMRVDRFPDFVAFLNAMPRTEVAARGLVDLDGHDRAADPRGLTARLLPADYREEPDGRRERMILQGGDHDKESRWAVRAG
jgi:hypothetical protein